MATTFLPIKIVQFGYYYLSSGVFHITRGRNAVQRATRFNAGIRSADDHCDIIRSASASGVHSFAFDHTAVVAQHDRLQLLSTNILPNCNNTRRDRRHRLPTWFTTWAHVRNSRPVEEDEWTHVAVPWFFPHSILTTERKPTADGTRVVVNTTKHSTNKHRKWKVRFERCRFSYYLELPSVWTICRTSPLRTGSIFVEFFPAHVPTHVFIDFQILVEFINCFHPPRRLGQRNIKLNVNTLSIRTAPSVSKIVPRIAVCFKF